jgi:lipopolysaccharide/colanic/teichoic acid biosynthesis glycosyltransferase
MSKNIKRAGLAALAFIAFVLVSPLLNVVWLAVTGQSFN